MWYRSLILALALLPQPTPPTVTATHTPRGIAVTWSAPEPVCPWLEWGSLRAYAGGALPCRASGSALVTTVPDRPARVVLRTEAGEEIKSTTIGYAVVLVLVVRP